jgi:uncharacterized OB-fold protein
MTSYAKPLPQITDENRAFWEGTRAGRLLMQRCDACSHLRFPISIVCPECLSPDHSWKPVSGTGEVFSYVVFHQIYDRTFADDVPYNVALVQLDDGPRMFSNIVGVPNDAVQVGTRVQVVFDAVTDEITLPRFTPVGP